MICRLAQRRLDPNRSVRGNGWLARHADSCPTCRAHFERLHSLENALRSEPPVADERLCAEIMRQVEVASAAADTLEKEVGSLQRSWVFGTAGLVAAAILVLAVVIFNGSEPEQAGNELVNAPPSIVVDPAPTPEPVTPVPEPVQPTPTLAQMMQQQEFLQRDARKLGAHLRERVILFRPLN